MNCVIITDQRSSGNSKAVYALRLTLGQTPGGGGAFLITKNIVSFEKPLLLSTLVVTFSDRTV